ncbi:uncharacterized protein LOC117102569 isoform X2 [Anneissia japonica]|uniref:uncharacterized protein LOC117102569 isoform X2 n=1 Tax=Anneissia japonica TaxID=1529436 RepID=UPI00142556DF|nr:uncharacterized protein LOC117102569 isoform X2 [Anneissia japonica]
MKRYHDCKEAYDYPLVYFVNIAAVGSSHNKLQKRNWSGPLWRRRTFRNRTAQENLRKMTFWSKHDPVRLPQAQTDHWTNMKLKCTTVQVAMPSGKVINRAGSAPASVPHDQWVATFQYNDNGSFSRLEDHTFTDILVNKLDGALPGTYDNQRSKSHRPTHRSNMLRTSYNTKAKEGFNYWQIERPKPTGCEQ